MSDVNVLRLRRYYGARKVIEAYCSSVEYLPKVLELDCRGGAGRSYLPIDIRYIGVSSTGMRTGQPGFEKILNKSSIETGDLPREQDIVLCIHLGVNRSKDILKVTRAAQCVLPKGFCIFSGDELKKEYIEDIVKAYFKESVIDTLEDQLFCLARGPKV